MFCMPPHPQESAMRYVASVRKKESTQEPDAESNANTKTLRDSQAIL